MIDGERIRALRAERGLSQKQLADLLGVSQVSVSNVENNLTGGSIFLLECFADLFKCSTDYLLGRDKEVQR